MIIDAHLHCSGAERGDDVLRSLDEARVDVGVLLAPFLSEGFSLDDAASLRRANEHLAGLVRGRADRLAGFAVVDPRDPKAPLHLRHAIETLGLVGAKMVPTGWYPQLFLTKADAQKVDPTIADVHTDPANSAVLHVATGLPRLMYVTVDGCNGPRAYAGVVSSYFEKTTTGLQRLTDQEWSTQIRSTPPADVSWVANLVVR